MTVILQTTDLDDGSPSGVEGSPLVACQTDAGWLAVRFDSDEQIYVATLSEDQVSELKPQTGCLIVNRIPYVGWGILRPAGWGEDPTHEAYYRGWRVQRQEEPGWLDRECRMHWNRALDRSEGPTPSATKKIRTLVETVVNELVANRPALVDFGQAADLRRQIDRIEADIFELEEKVGEKERELRGLRARLEEMSR